MEPNFQPVMPSATTADAAPRGWIALGTSAESRPAQHLLAARAVDAADRRRRAGRHVAQLLALFKAAPIMTPLLMFGVMIGMLFVVTALRNSVWGVVALLGFTFIAGVLLTPILTVAAGFRNGGAAGRAGRRHDRGDLLRHGDDRHGVQAGFLLPGQVPVHRHDPADRRLAREPVLPGAGGVADDLGDRRADLLRCTCCTTSAASSAAARPTTSWPRSACS